MLGLVAIGRWQQIRLVALPPNIGTVLGDQGLDVLQGVGVEQHLATGAVIEDRDGHAPGALAADAPVAPLPHHAFNAVAATGRQPFHRVDGAEGVLAEALHRGKPLLRGAEDRRFFGAPVVGVAVFVAFFGQERLGLLQSRDDRGVGVFQHVEPSEGPGLLGEPSPLIDGAEHGQVVFAAGVEVVDAMARGRVHQAGAGFGGDVVAANHHRAAALQQWMAIGQALKGFAFDLLQWFELELQLLAEAAHQLSGNDQLPAAAALANAVVEPAIDGDGQVGRQGPRGGGPDGDR